MTRRALIVGCGYVGSALAERLVARGYEVWGLNRSERALPAGVHALRADVADPRTLTALPDDLDFVIYAVSAGASNDDAYRRAYVDGLHTVLDALTEQRQSPKRIVFTSSTGVYGQSDGEWVDEDSLAESDHFMGARVREGERLLEASSFPGTSVRFGGIYGPGRSGLLQRVRSGEAKMSSGPPEYINLIHRDDCAGIVLHVLDAQQPGNVYVGVDCEPSDRNEVYRWIATRLGLPEPSMGETGPGAHRPRGNKRCNNARIRSNGYEFQFPSYRAGLEQVLGLE